MGDLKDHCEGVVSMSVASMLRLFGDPFMVVLLLWLMLKPTELCERADRSLFPLIRDGCP